MTMRIVIRGAAALAVVVCVAGTAEAAGAQGVPAPAPGVGQPAGTATPSAPMRLTLTEAIRLATTQSESLDIARAGETRATADVDRARSQKLPQINFTGGYQRTLASEFNVDFSSGAAPCAPLNVDATKPLADRVAELERAASCGAIGSQSLGVDFSKLPFGQANTYQATFDATQAIYAGGRISAQQAQADLSRRLAAFSLSAADAQVTLDVTQAFYDAALSDRLVDIAQLGYDQAAAAYDQTQQAYQAGRQPEFELLRAQVARDNDRPTVIRNRASRDVAYLRLRQLLKLAPDAPLVLDVDLDAATLGPPAPFADALANATSAAALDRIAVKQAATGVETRKAAITVARAERLPTVNLATLYGKIGFPSGTFPGWNDFRTNWTAGVNVAMPVFTGGRLKADELSARADLTEAEAELKQSRELAVLDSATAEQDLAAAEAVWEASAGTIEQAERAYQIAELRNREGLSTQLELSDSRLSLQVAEANRAQAARDLQVARAHVALLPNLPVTAR